MVKLRLTSEILPPKGQWVLVTTEDWQKPWEIKCFLGIHTGVKYVRYPEKRGFIEEEYEYPAWTSGHGDIQSKHPYGWMPLPNHLLDKDIQAFNVAISALEQMPTVQDKQAESEKYQKAFDDGYANGYEQARFDYEQQPCEDAVSLEMVREILSKYHLGESKIAEDVNELPSVTQKSGKWIGYSDEGYDEEAIEKLELMRQKVDEETYRALILAIKALEQKPKTGHWIYDETLENWRCSKCNETPKTMGYVGTADFMAEHFKFCNHCGAKMVEPQESEE